MIVTFSNRIKHLALCLPKALNGRRPLLTVLRSTATTALVTVALPITALAEVKPQIYFLAKTLGPASAIYSKDITPGSKINHITNNPKWRDMSFNVGENHIVFMSNRHKYSGIDLKKQSEQFNIYVIPRTSGRDLNTSENNTNITEIAATQYDETHPKLSPGDTHIAYRLRQPDKESLIIYSLSNKKQTHSFAAHEVTDYAWHPAQNKIAVIIGDATTTQLILWDLKNGKKTKLLELPKADHSTLANVTWNPNGEQIAYIVNPGTQEAKRSLFVLSLQSHTHTMISPIDVDVQHPIDWSADGKRIVFSGLENYAFYYDEKSYKKVYEGSMRLYLWETGTKVTPITPAQGLHNKPVFSPDGKYIAYLYAEELSATSTALMYMALGGPPKGELFKPVASVSELEWK